VCGKGVADADVQIFVPTNSRFIENYDVSVRTRREEVEAVRKREKGIKFADIFNRWGLNLRKKPASSPLASLHVQKECGFIVGLVFFFSQPRRAF